LCPQAYEHEDWEDGESVAQLWGWEDVAFIPQRKACAAGAQKLRGGGQRRGTWAFISPQESEDVKTRVRWY